MASTPTPAARRVQVVPLSALSHTPAPWASLKRAVRSPDTEANLTPTGGLLNPHSWTPGMAGIIRGSGVALPTPGPEVKRGRMRTKPVIAEARSPAQPPAARPVSPFHVKYPLPPPRLREANIVRVINERVSSTDSPGFTMARGINPTTNVYHSGRMFLGLPSLLSESTTSSSLLSLLEHTGSTNVACLTILPLQIPEENSDAFADVPFILDSMLDVPQKQQQLTATVSWLTNPRVTSSNSGGMPMKGSHTGEYAFLVLTREDIESLGSTDDHHLSCMADRVLKTTVEYYLNPSPSGHLPETRAVSPPASTCTGLLGAPPQ